MLVKQHRDPLCDSVESDSVFYPEGLKAGGQTCGKQIKEVNSMFEKKLQPVFVTSDKSEFKTADEAKVHEVEIVFPWYESDVKITQRDICSRIVENATALVPILQQGLKRKYNKGKKPVVNKSEPVVSKKAEKPARAFGEFDGGIKAGE